MKTTNNEKTIIQEYTFNNPFYGPPAPKKNESIGSNHQNENKIIEKFLYYYHSQGGIGYSSKDDVK